MIKTLLYFCCIFVIFLFCDLLVHVLFVVGLESMNVLTLPCNRGPINDYGYVPISGYVYGATNVSQPNHLNNNNHIINNQINMNNNHIGSNHMNNINYLRNNYMNHHNNNNQILLIIRVVKIILVKII